MKKFFKIFGILLLSIILIGIAFFGYARYKLNNIKDTKNLQDLVDLKSRKLIDNKKVVGFSLGLIKNNEIYIASYGFANIESKIKIDSTTIFEIGSISKVFTTEIAQILVERNIINWDVDIINFYPNDFVPKINDKTKLIHLATHCLDRPSLIASRIPSRKTHLTKPLLKGDWLCFGGCFAAVLKTLCLAHAGVREGKGVAPFFWAFFSPEKRAGAGDRPVRGTPK